LFKIKKKAIKLFCGENLDNDKFDEKYEAARKKISKVIKGLFTCTSYNNFSNSTFYINSKIKEEARSNDKK